MTSPARTLIRHHKALFPSHSRHLEMLVQSYLMISSPARKPLPSASTCDGKYFFQNVSNVPNNNVTLVQIIIVQVSHFVYAGMEYPSTAADAPESRAWLTSHVGSPFEAELAAMLHLGESYNLVPDFQARAGA